MNKYLKEKEEHEYMISIITKASIVNKKKNRKIIYELTTSKDKWYNNGENLGYLISYSTEIPSGDAVYHQMPRLAFYLDKVIRLNLNSLIKEAIKLSEIDLSNIKNEARSQLTDLLSD